ncbi:MAG: hypothetical protein Q8L86_19315 [Vicinamibacterales bacterium]|nr:hypothetical protein [Vicinamibacterales bacterium]
MVYRLAVGISVLLMVGVAEGCHTWEPDADTRDLVLPFVGAVPYPPAGLQSTCPQERLSLLVAITKTPAMSGYNGDHVQRAVTRLNRALSNSRLNWSVEVTTRINVQDPDDSASMKDIHTELESGGGRWAYLLQPRQADLFAIAVGGRPKDYHGVARIAAGPNTAVTVIHADQAFDDKAIGLAHEFGHLAGIRHQDDPEEIPDRQGHAYATKLNRTVTGAPGPRSLFFSHPPDHGTEDWSNAVAVMQKTLPYLAGFHCESMAEAAAP